MNNKIYDVLVVGMGLAGINTSYSAAEQNLTCYHIHHSLPGESTHVAAGLINPITGRRFVKSWMIEEVMPFAESRYKKLEAHLGGVYISRLNIIRRLLSYADENTWLAKSADLYLKDFLLDNSTSNGFSDSFTHKLHIPEITGELQDCFRIHLTQLQQDYINKQLSEELCSIEVFDHKQLEIQKEYLQYKNIKAKNLVFCEGWKQMENPFFDTVPIAPAKGELLIIHAPELQLNKAFKQDIFVTPLGEDLYWVGATYEWQNYDPNVTDKMRSKLLSSLDEMIQVPYTIKEHLSGIRPASKDRKPILGPHPNYKNLYIFNGMGTKGSSLAPYFSKMLIDNISMNTPIIEEVSVNRYYS